MITALLFFCGIALGVWLTRDAWRYYGRIIRGWFR